MEPGFHFTDYQKAELENSFKKFSPNSEGKITIESVNNLIKTIESTKSNKQEISPSDYSVDPQVAETKTFLNGSSECDFDTFISTLEDAISKPDVFEKALAQSFRLMDMRGTGFIEAQDLMQLAEILGENLSGEEEARRIIHRAEENSEDGKMTIKSLRAFLHNDIDSNLSP
ncbi:unnamed protein product [Blepharisma stoltei]|uniref:Calmodulin n=1 Tax=Blepharisma stoltei TaxID=1481888 RepID=A0AAU9J3S0_9CILI|nr:unnamed protein product [Blepharisma stoltei]